MIRIMEYQKHITNLSLIIHNAEPQNVRSAEKPLLKASLELLS